MTAVELVGLEFTALPGRDVPEGSHSDCPVCSEPLRRVIPIMVDAAPTGGAIADRLASEVMFVGLPCEHLFRHYEVRAS